MMHIVVLRPVRYTVETLSFPAPCTGGYHPPVTPDADSTPLNGTGDGLPPLGFPRGEAGMINNRLFGTDYLP